MALLALRGPVQKAVKLAAEHAEPCRGYLPLAERRVVLTRELRPDEVDLVEDVRMYSSGDRDTLDLPEDVRPDVRAERFARQELHLSSHQGL